MDVHATTRLPDRTEMLRRIETADPHGAAHVVHDGLLSQAGQDVGAPRLAAVLQPALLAYAEAEPMAYPLLRALVLPGLLHEVIRDEDVFGGVVVLLYRG
ncbi:hypothetical protein AB0O64_24000 [Streptomyces sp. NPDC088341]|uniref:hypothetical protein n=1 Tax=Streptomyces sp. NPDC088341 TaxID=3154870 RepID=UPI00342CE72E